MSQDPGQHKILPSRDQRIVTWLGRIWSHKKEREPEPPTFGSCETNKSWSSFLCLFVSANLIFSLPEKLCSLGNPSTFSTCRDRRRRHSVSLEEKAQTSPDHEETREIKMVRIPAVYLKMPPARAYVCVVKNNKVWGVDTFLNIKLLNFIKVNLYAMATFLVKQSWKTFWGRMTMPLNVR